MSANIPQIKSYLKSCNFRAIFNESIGWENLRDKPPVVLYQGKDYRFTPLAHKERVKIYTCILEGDTLPDAVPKKIDRPLDAHGLAHLTIFTDAKKENQVWLWVKREADQPARAYLWGLNKNQSGESLARKIAGLFIDVAEEGRLSHSIIVARMRSAFEVERVVKSFYTKFKDQHTKFLDAIAKVV